MPRGPCPCSKINCAHQQARQWSDAADSRQKKSPAGKRGCEVGTLWQGPQVMSGCSRSGGQLNLARLVNRLARAGTAARRIPCLPSMGCLPAPRGWATSAQSLGRQACEAKRAAQGQGRRRSKACCHSAPDVDRRQRTPVVIKGGCKSTCIANSRDQAAETNVPAGTLALVRSPLALLCSKEQSALHTLIHQRRLTPSCGGHAPTAERTMDPVRMFTESLTPRPELENSQGH